MELELIGSIAGYNSRFGYSSSCFPATGARFVDPDGLIDTFHYARTVVMVAH